MFTGIINGIGIVEAVMSVNTERRFRINPLFPMPNITDGESIAVNGACLSVETHDQNKFLVYASRETINRTTLGALHTGSRVNLERALEVGDRIGGHLVSGHVDCIANLTQRRHEGFSQRLKIIFPRQFGPQIVEKGSVALDGISLTVNACGQDWLEVNIIPDSQKKTNILSWKIGDAINMETDIIGKYVERMMTTWTKNSKSGSIGISDLASYGFI